MESSGGWIGFTIGLHGNGHLPADIVAAVSRARDELKKWR
jgi:hypothetical protein